MGGQNTTNEQSLRILSEAGLRRTPMRIAMLNLLSAARSPLTVPEILERLGSDMDSVTVYRTLHTFTESKLVHRILGEDRSWRYATSASQAHAVHAHPHFVCDGCGTVECLAKSRIPSSFIPSLHIGREYRVKFPEVVLHGLCPKCA